MKIPQRTETEDSAARLKRFHELDAQIIQALADIKKVAADFADDELPPGYINLAGFEELFRTRGQSLGITLTPADEDGFNVIGLYLSAGAVVSRETILKCLRLFNPARQLAEGA